MSDPWPADMMPFAAKPSSAAPTIRRESTADVLKVLKRAFEGAKIDRINGKWTTTSQSIDLQLGRDGKRLRDRARDLIQNNGFARGAQNAIVSNTLGTGIWPQPRLAESKRKKLWRDEWCRFADEADITGHQHLYELMALSLKEVIQTGEVLHKYVFFSAQDRRRYRRRSTLGLQLIEAERLVDNQEFFGPTGKNGETGNEIRHGVEVDSRFGRPVAYWLLPEHPNDLFSTHFKPERIDAGYLRHQFVRERIGQHRGITWLAAAVQWLYKLGAYTENEMVASTLAACLMVAIETADGSAPSLTGDDGDDTTDKNGNKLDRFEPGMVARLGLGEKIQQIMPSRPNAQADPWISLMLRSIGVSMDLGYEVLSRDHSKTNFSGQRGEELESRRRYKQIIAFIVHAAMAPLYRLWVEQNVLVGTEGFPPADEYAADPDVWLAVNWTSDAREWIDPTKEQSAAEAELAAGMNTLQHYCASRGLDWEEVIEQRSIEIQRCKDKGVPIPQPKTAATAADQGQQQDGQSQAA
jgi:lambda family phage portal protein